MVSSSSVVIDLGGLVFSHSLACPSRINGKYLSWMASTGTPFILIPSMSSWNRLGCDRGHSPSLPQNTTEPRSMVMIEVLT
ncbi:unnamed protein product [Linum trigynum]|uniref:Uncharacterized protein n=1 Tax=Linum trigynum TaxID=586398 RepID=A0AAV2FWG3_9ROSI